MISELKDSDLKWGQIVSRAWLDGDFKRRLLENPGAVFQEYNFNLLSGLPLKILEAPESPPDGCTEFRYLVLPAKPSSDELREASALEPKIETCRCKSSRQN